MNSRFLELYNADLSRYGSANIGGWRHRFHYFFRRCQTETNPFLLAFYRILFSWNKKKHGIEIYYGTQIGEGFYIDHPYNITINAKSVIGKNVNLSKNVTIGAENRGVREGTPIIGNYVWIGTGAVVVGHIHIGDDVLIAPNAFVNIDIPSHSIVIGNPCIIKSCEGAVRFYINNIVE